MNAVGILLKSLYIVCHIFLTNYSGNFVGWSFCAGEYSQQPIANLLRNYTMGNWYMVVGFFVYVHLSFYASGIKLWVPCSTGLAKFANVK